MTVPKTPRSLVLHLGLADGLLIAGADEAGRGPLAGDVVAAAVILDADHPITGLDDSKQLSSSRRAKLMDAIVRHATAYAIARASVQEIDQFNILQASLLAMKRAVLALKPQPDYVYVDGNRCPLWQYQSKAVVGGDGRIQSIAAASILAKVTRDDDLQKLDRDYPGYGFARHKGYPTAAHLEALRTLGPSPVHRRSFRPVAALFDQC
jgi:ribonuclease HII